MYAINNPLSLQAPGATTLGFPGLSGAANDRLTLGMPDTQMSAPIDPMSQAMQAQTTLLSSMMGLLLKLMLNGPAGNNGGASTSTSTSTSTDGSVQALGGSSASANSSSAATTSNVDSGSTGSGGSAAVALGQKFLGRNAADIKGSLSHFTAAGGQTNNCADFVSSLLESTGGLKGHFVGVSALEGALKQQGYHQVSAAQSKPGDVWISNSRSHTEMVAAAGGKRTIGSNNDRPGHQVISERDKAPGTGVFYSKG